jgi:hypothetical protein
MNITIKNKIVSNDGAEIGQIVGDTCHLLQPVGPAIKSGISKAHGSKLKFEIVSPGNTGEPGEPGPDGSTGNIGEPGHHEPDERNEPSRSHEVAGKPERNPILGEKCPKFIAWKSAQKGDK